MKFKTLGFAGIAVAMFAAPAFAHHSFAMFNGQQKLTLQGTVKTFQWTFPHCWIVMVVPNAAGKTDEWPIEMMGPTNLVKYGWLPKTLTPGMKVTAVIHPLKDGKHGGQYLSVTLPGGKMLSISSRVAGAGGGGE